jgi:hypothetical protein
MEAFERPSVIILIAGLVFAASLGFYLVRTYALTDTPETITPNDSFKAVVTVGEPTIEVDTSSRCVQSVDELPEAPDLFSDADSRLRNGLVIVVIKSTRALMVMYDGSLASNPNDSKMCYRVALGIDRQGRSTSAFDKTVQGDHRTPEGWYRVSDKPWSQYKDAIRIHYPNDRHASRGLRDGLVSRETFDQIVSANARHAVPPQDTRLGGEILIHGDGSFSDWTWGCVALDDDDLAKLRSALPNGMRSWILILP